MNKSRKRRSKSFADSLESRRVSLTPRRQEILRPVFERPQDFVLLSIRSSAERLGTDSSFLLRVVQQLGFKCYPDFKKYLHDQALSNATSFDRLRDSAIRESSPQGLVRATFERSIENVSALAASVDPERMIALAQRIHEARHVLLLTGDLTAAIGDYLGYQMMMLGLAPLVLHGAGEMIHAVRAVTRDDVVLAMTFRRGLRSTVESLREAHKHGAYCVAVTNVASAPVTRFAHQVHVVGIEGASMRSSFVAPMAFADALAACLANVDRKKTLGLLRDASQEQTHGYRWFNEQI